MPAHKHANLMLAYAADAQKTDKPWLLWQLKSDSPYSIWQPLDASPQWLTTMLYRRKPEPVITYHVLYSDGSMSQGFDSLEHETLKLHMKHALPGFRLIKLTRIDGEPTAICLVEKKT